MPLAGWGDDAEPAAQWRAAAVPDAGPPARKAVKRRARWTPVVPVERGWLCRVGKPGSRRACAPVLCRRCRRCGRARPRQRQGRTAAPWRPHQAAPSAPAAPRTARTNGTGLSASRCVLQISRRLGMGLDYFPRASGSTGSSTASVIPRTHSRSSDHVRLGTARRQKSGGGHGGSDLPRRLQSRNHSLSRRRPGRRRLRLKRAG